MKHRIHWVVGLNNGETHTEEKGNFCTEAGALSPWQRLLSYIAENNLEITSVALLADDGRRWALPSKGKMPKFKAFAEAPKPIAYKFFRKLGGDVMGDKVINEDRYSCIEAQYEDGQVVQTWVDEKEGQASWTLLL